MKVNTKQLRQEAAEQLKSFMQQEGDIDTILKKHQPAIVVKLLQEAKLSKVSHENIQTLLLYSQPAELEELHTSVIYRLSVVENLSPQLSHENIIKLALSDITINDMVEMLKTEDGAESAVTLVNLRNFFS